jgi:large subunit ribosomal protein L17
MLRNMACSLITHKRIKTTLAKAKELRVFVEPLITKSKDDTMATRRVVFSYLQDKQVVKELFGNVRPEVLNRNGGYTRILKIGNRLGDNAEMAVIELVDFSTLNPGKSASTDANAADTKKKSRRQKKSGAKSETPSPLIEDAVVIEETHVENTDTAAEVVDNIAEEEKDKGDSSES